MKPHNNRTKRPCLLLNVAYDSAHMPHAVSDQHIQILHLEDSVADHELARIALQRAGMSFTIERVETLTDFETKLAQKTFDVVVADYRLQGFTAIDAWVVLTQQRKAAPFVLLSGAIGEAAAVDAMRLGIADYLLKDDTARLAHVIQRAIEVYEAKREKDRMVRELSESQQRLAQLTDHLQVSIEQERASIAREIHDDIGGALAAIRFDLAWIKRHSSDTGTLDHIDAASDMLQHAIEASQRIMMNLRPPVLDQGLVAAVQWLASSFERRTGVATKVTSSAENINTTDVVELVAYRTAQEALTNIFKYANATTVSIDLTDSEDVLTLEITDNGIGMSSETLTKTGGFGLKGLHERARTANGWLDVSSRPGQGTSVILSIPLSKPPPTGDTT
jgi:signal transduction histidine kinase